MTHLGRRAFIGLLGSAAAWPIAARGQQAMPTVGFLYSVSSETRREGTFAFRRGLSELGYFEDQNVTVEYRWARGQLGRLPELATDLVQRRVAVIVVNNAATRAAQEASAETPIVFVSGADLVRTGLVPRLSRPGGRITGTSYVGGGDLIAKRLSLLHELVQTRLSVAALLDPNHVEVETELQEVERAANAIGRKLLIVKAAQEGDCDTSFSTLTQSGTGALLVGGGGFFNNQRRRVVALAVRHAICAIYNLREFVEAGGLMSYGASTADAYRRAGVYVGRILKGADPGELPVELPTSFEIVINLPSAKALGLDIPATLLARADEAIE